MKQRFNLELAILVFIFFGFLDFSLWRNVDPTSLSDAEQEKIGLNKVHNLNRYNRLKD